MMAAAGLEVDEVHTSLMRRAVRSAVLMLSTLNQCWVPVRKHLVLNEQHSGSLTGMNKRELAREKGEEQVMAWRRKYDEPPPAIAPDNALQLAIEEDARYDPYPGGIPTTESLADVCKRVGPLWEETILPSLRAGKTVMVVTHGNTLRALVMKIDGVTEEDVYFTDLPTATPLLYDFDEQLNHLKRHGEWGDRPTAPRHGRYLVDEERVRAAQLAMRQQVSQDLETAGPTGVVGPACTASRAGSEISEIDGQFYTVRQTPPAYFFQESGRLELEARAELAEFRLRADALKVAGQKKQVRCTLVLLRHGQSTYNQAKVFTGWADPDLTNRGRDEARLAGQLLKATGITVVDTLYTSLLKRAVKTAWLALDELELTWTPVRHTWRLNERNYGDLQGKVKSECVSEHGLQQVQRWRRGYTDRPPVWSEAERLATVDRRYDLPSSLDPEHFPPLSESLQDCQARLLPFLEDELQPAMMAAVERAKARAAASGAEYEVPALMVVASENVMRGLVMHLEGLSEEQIPLVDVPYAVPLVYQMDSAIKPIRTPWAESPLQAGWYLGDPAKVRAVKEEIKADLPSPAEGEESCLVPLGGEDGDGEWTC